MYYIYFFYNSRLLTFLRFLRSLPCSILLRLIFSSLIASGSCRLLRSGCFLLSLLRFLLLLLARLDCLRRLPGDVEELFQLVVLVRHIEVVVVSAVFLAVEDLWRQRKTLTLLLLCAGPHEISLFLAPWGGDVHQVHLDPQALQDHDDPLLANCYLLAAAVAGYEDPDGGLGCGGRLSLSHPVWSP